MKEKIANLVEHVRTNQIGVAGAWQGADVVITKKAPSPSVDNFYPDPRFVETRFVGELSWLFEQLRDVFMKSDGYGFWKEELFGRLGNVAVKFQSVCPECSVVGLLEKKLLEIPRPKMARSATTVGKGLGRMSAE